jgi:hypothetical protein
VAPRSFPALAIVGEIDLDIAGEAGLELYKVVQNE